MYKSMAGNEVNTEAMDKAQKHNKDGYGVAWYENGFVNTYKTFDYSQFKRVCKALESHTLVIHLRYATKGNKSYSNIHPFDTPSGVMFHNGTMFGLGDTHTSDSQELAEILSECTYGSIKDIKPLVMPYIYDKINRLVFFEDTGEVVTMNEHLGIKEDNGDWYSNDYHLKDSGWCRKGECTVATTTVTVSPSNTTKVFVYGTLKKGLSNHDRYLSGAKFLGNATTLLTWAMIGEGKGFPYLLFPDKTQGLHIKGEVYEVNEQQKKMLDYLEGVPTHYKEAYIGVKYDDGAVTHVKTYIKATIDKSDVTHKYISEWKPTVSSVC